uniref:Uncharacterized protein n=1 Tax=Arundo donax TaxID=35708 RepID=A0A0A9CE85_ARUDO
MAIAGSVCSAVVTQFVFLRCPLNRSMGK